MDLMVELDDSVVGIHNLVEFVVVVGDRILLVVLVVGGRTRLVGLVRRGFVLLG